ncbi:MAG TPA: hypothetical protein VF815_07920 [Myxococcaceae bacterium]|jgi:hypothetical protein
MKRRILIVLLALGTVGGYSSGIASLRYRKHCRKAWTESRTSHTYVPYSERAEAPPPSSPR